MIAMFGVPKLLFLAPVLAALTAFTALGRPADDVQADATVVPPAVVAEVTLDAIDDAAALVVSNCTYYSNASHTTVVGRFGYDCCNNPVAWGRKTRYSVCGGCFPCIPPPQ